jgi:hypothetical protein
MGVLYRRVRITEILRIAESTELTFSLLVTTLCVVTHHQTLRALSAAIHEKDVLRTRIYPKTIDGEVRSLL